MKKPKGYPTVWKEDEIAKNDHKENSLSKDCDTIYLGRFYILRVVT